MTQTISKFQLIDWIKNSIDEDAIINFTVDDFLTYQGNKRIEQYRIKIFAANVNDVDKVPKSILSYTEDELRKEESKAQARLDYIFSEFRRRNHVD